MESRTKYGKKRNNNTRRVPSPLSLDPTTTMKQSFTTKQKFYGIVHAVIMLLAYTSPLWLDWKLMIVGVILYYIQLLIFGGCLLTKAQFGRFDATFTGYYLNMLLATFGIKAKDRKIKLFLDTLAPIFIIIAIISQVIFNFKPIVSI